MTTTIENLHSNKRKFISDVEIYIPSNQILSMTNQIESYSNTKKLKILETEQSSTFVDENNDKMIYENSSIKLNDTEQTNDTKPMLIPQDCNRICNVDPSPTTLMIRCYCHPYRINALIPYDLDIY